MFIVTNYNIASDVIIILDTDDNRDEAIRLSVLAYHVNSGKIAVKGLSKSQPKSVNAVFIPNLGIYINPDEAHKALDKYYKKHGIKVDNIF